MYKSMVAGKVTLEHMVFIYCSEAVQTLLFNRVFSLFVSLLWFPMFASSDAGNGRIGVSSAMSCSATDFRCLGCCILGVFPML